MKSTPSEKSRNLAVIGDLGILHHILHHITVTVILQIFNMYDPVNGNFRILKWRYVNVPFFRPYFVGIFPYIGQKIW